MLEVILLVVLLNAVVTALLYKMVWEEIERANQPVSGTEWVPQQKQKSPVIENNL